MITVPKPTGTSKTIGAAGIRWAASKVGTVESPAWSNHIFAWTDVAPSLQGEPWCAGFVTDAWARQGIDLRRWVDNPYYCPSLEAWAKGRHIWHSYGSGYDPHPGDLAIMGRSMATHVGLAAPAAGNYSGYRQIEGNTVAEGAGGSQTNGNGVWVRYRGSFIRGWVDMHALIGQLVKGGKITLASGTSSGNTDPVAAKKAFSFAVMMTAVPTTAKAKYPGRFSGNVRIAQTLMAAQSEMRFCNTDGIWTTKTTRAYKTWQRALGYRGSDADGIPGRDSLAKLVARGGYTLI